ncbi:DUF1801 domain-containing protein [Hydrogenophaga sp. A37]|uniref:DUF1801 domain-containing protein n=1 Tax=Hydrogenophaga sp. A37 TaxID=1945864 RepID=UPI001C0DCE6F|nr:DUF1801 domain-containing protein [Hydrogenophaga sp. A37]
MEHDPAVDAWLNGVSGELGALAQAGFQRLRECGAGVRELMHDGFATVCVQDAPFAYVGAFKAHVNIGFFHGVALPDPTGLLEGTGKRMRHVKLRPGRPVDEAALDALIAAAYRDILVRLE